MFKISRRFVKPETIVKSVAGYYRVSEDELKALYQTVKRCLRLTRLMNTDNINVLNVRASLDTCNKCGV